MFSSVVDREELRKDKAVEVPIDEVEELITEYLRENEAFLVRARSSIVEFRFFVSRN